MCESKVYLVSGGRQELLFEGAVRVAEDGDEVVITGILGEKKAVANARVAEVDARKHIVILKRAPMMKR